MLLTLFYLITYYCYLKMKKKNRTCNRRKIAFSKRSLVIWKRLRVELLLLERRQLRGHLKVKVFPSGIHWSFVETCFHIIVNIFEVFFSFVVCLEFNVCKCVMWHPAQLSSTIHSRMSLKVSNHFVYTVSDVKEFSNVT